MPEKKISQKPFLHYAEDYLQQLLELSKREEKAEVEIREEGEKEGSLDVRIISTTSDGKRAETTYKVPRAFLSGVPLLTTIHAKSPPIFTRPKLSIQKEFLTEVRLKSSSEIMHTLQSRILTFTPGFGKLVYCNLPYLMPKFYSWFIDGLKKLDLFEQPGITAFTERDLLRLIEISPKLPIVSEKVETREGLPNLTSERFAVQHEIGAKLTQDVASIQTEAQAQRLRDTGLLELLIPEEKEKLRHLVASSGEYAGEPIIIILPESEHHLWYLFWIACREIFREVRGSYPEPAVLLEKGYEEWLRLPGGISGRIVVLHGKHLKNGEEREWLKRKFQETFSQGLGFLILLSKNPDETEGFVKEICKPHSARTITISKVPGYGSILNLLPKVLCNIFGIPEVEVCSVEGLGDEEKIVNIVNGKPQEFPQMDVMISRVDRKYRNFLEDMLTSRFVAHVRRNPSETESEDHIAMKVLTIQELNERYDVKIDKIDCESEVGDRIIADVYAEEKALAIECETLLGTAPTPMLKIFKSVRKYIENKLNKPVEEVWVIIRSWSVALHLGTLYWVENILRNDLKKDNKKVKFFAPHIERKSLQAIDDIIMRL